MEQIYNFVAQGAKARINFIKHCENNMHCIFDFEEHYFIYALNALAKAYECEYKFDEAIRTYNLILSKYQNHTPAHIKIAHIMVKQHKIDEAIEYLENVLEDIKIHPYYYSDLLTKETKLHYQYESDIHCLSIYIQELKDKKASGYNYKPRKKK